MAYMRRKRWESRLLAVMVVNALGEAMQKPHREPMGLGALAALGFRVEAGTWHKN